MGEKMCLSMARERGRLCFPLVIVTYGTSRGHAHLPLASPLSALNTQASGGLLPPAHFLVSSFASPLVGAFGRRGCLQVFAAFARFCVLDVM